MPPVRAVVVMLQDAVCCVSRVWGTQHAAAPASQITWVGHASCKVLGPPVSAVARPAHCCR